MTDIPTFPALSDRAGGDYNGMAFAFARHMSDKFVQEIVPVAESLVANATDAQSNALLATQAREQTQQDRAATGSDRAATAADRNQTGLDRIAAQAAAQQIGTAAAFTDTNPVVKNSADATKRIRFLLNALTSGAMRDISVQDRNGILAFLDDLDRRPVTYAVSAVPALDFATASYVRYAPAVGSTVAISVANFDTAAAGLPNSFRVGIVEGFRLGAATTTWPGWTWVRPDGTHTTNIAQAGFTLSSTGIDFLIVWERAGDTTMFAKAIR